MPFIPNTPESMIARSDSKNPDGTCRGITSGGRPCRRPLNSASPSSSPLPPKSKKVKKLRVDDPSDPDLYCWQHKDQASQSAKSSPAPRRDQTPILEGRESLDTLIDRLGITEAQKQGRKPAHDAGRYGDDRRNEKIGQSGNMDSPDLSAQKPQVKSRARFCCCFTIPIMEEKEEERPTRPRPTPVQGAPAGHASAKLPQNQQHLTASSGGPRPSSALPPKPSSAQSNVSQTSQYLSMIPATASPQTASQLMAELAKPCSPQDEPGYIYIFWLTPESQSTAPPTDAAKSLLTPPTRPDARQRRASDVVESFASKNSGRNAGGSAKKTMLKVGRASNVQRRLNEWTRQCGYELSLIRYYPYISSATPSTPRKMPHSHKVERLIHIELAGAGLRVSDKGACEACGKAHREWFEVDASRAGISMIDEVVRRWSDWDEARG
ncbi:DUF1766-domain-containing protein [Whalleya microplaca]|nr:DUF1766-domain-containing protein [Whalleya microplaca]